MCLCIHELLRRLTKSVIVRVASGEHFDRVDNNLLQRNRRYIYTHHSIPIYMYMYVSVYS